MDGFTNRKNQIEQSISEIILKEMEEERLTGEDAMGIIDYSLLKIKAINTQEELHVFLSDISTKWPFFTPLASIEQGKAKEENADEVVEHIADVAQAGNIDEALNLAKAATNN